MFRWLTGLRVAIRSLFRKQADAELDEEIQYHLDREIQEGVKTGLTPEESRHAALRAMGDIGRSKEDCRDVRSATFVDRFAGDIRYAARTLRRNPAFAVPAIAVMALGIGANAAVFSVINGVLLKPLPYPGADRIVALSTADVRTSQINPLVVIANFRDWRDQSSSFDAMATYVAGELPVSKGGEAEFVRGATVDPQFFRVFAVQPALGRTFAPEEVTPESRSVVISHAFWQSRFGGDTDVLQQTLRVGGGDELPIVGVMPAGFRFPGEADLWLPDVDATENSSRLSAATAPADSRTRHNRLAVGRLEPDVSLEQAQAELTLIGERLAQQYPESNTGRHPTAARLQDVLVGDLRPTLYLLWSVVGVVLLIACANTATLLLGKAAARTREIAVRAAIGASRRRIVQQLITESLLLALAAGALGIALARWGAQTLIVLAPFDVVRFAEITIDRGVLAFTLAVSLATSLLFGLVPAFQAAKVDLNLTLKTGGAPFGLPRRAIDARGLLVLSEIALAVVLLTGAGLLVKSLVALHNVELGYRPDNVLVMRSTGVRPIRENNAFFTEVMSRVAKLPGVSAVGATSIPPGDLSNSGSGSYFVDRRPEQRDRATEATALFTVVAPGSFAALRIPLVSGRDFDEGDIFDRPLVAIVNESLVRRSFGGANAIGRTIFCSFDRPNDGMTIVGVVGDVRQRNPALEPIPECYMPYRQHSYNNATLNVLIRTTGDPLALAAPVRRVAAEVSPDVPVSFTTMDETVARRMETPRFRTLLFAVFAALAVGLAIAGVYSVTAYAVEQRWKEIAVRIALGARRGVVLRGVLSQGLALAAAGLALGLMGAAATTQLLTSMLFEVDALDVPVFLTVVVLIATVSLLASYVPGRRATVANPVEILRAD